VQRQRPKSLENLLLKPYYWRRPIQVIRRLRYLTSAPSDPTLVKLPWGLDIECSPREMIGSSIIRTGVFEPVTTEALVRLVAPGDLVLDAGANIGYMTSLLAKAVGSTGRVIAYEPNPDVNERLARNVRRWRLSQLPKIDLRSAALSDQAGTASLVIPIAENECASIGDTPVRRASQGAHTTVIVPTVTIDCEIDGDRVGVLKLDVEDHEPAVLRGARATLAEGRIRDIVLEDHNQYPSESTTALEQYGYTVFNLAMRPRGLVLKAPGGQENYTSWHAPMRLATRDPDRARQKLSSDGWLSLRNPIRW
jgi:FkbM family methyltransferase